MPNLFGGKKGKSESASGRRGRFSDEIRGNNIEVDDSFKRGATLRTFHGDDRQKSDRQRAHDLRSSRRKLGSIMLVVLIVCSLGLILLSQYGWSIGSFTSNAPALSAADNVKYQEIVNKYLSENPFERFRFALRQENLNRYIAISLPEVESAKLSLGGIMSSKLTITFRKPIAFWDVSSGQRSYVDSSGNVFKTNYFGTPNVSIVDDSHTSNSVSSDGAVASSSLLSFIGQVTALIDSSGSYKVEKVQIPSDAIRYVNFFLTGKNYPFKAQTNRSSSSQAEDIIATQKYLDKNNIKPTYVDARINGKAYWR